MTPIISIIVPCYNQGHFLAECLDSVLSQSISNWECVIVDDGSTDDSAMVAKKYSELDERIHYLYQNNAGPSVARNNGTKNSHGKYLLFLDADNKIESIYTEEGIKYLDSHSDCVLFKGQGMTFGNIVKKCDWNYKSYKYFLRDNSIDCCSIIRRKDFEHIGGFDEYLKGYEDWEFFIRLLYRNDVIYQDPRVMFHYRIKDEEGVNRTAKARHNSLFQYIYIKNIEIYNEFYGRPNELLSQIEWLEAWRNRTIIRWAGNLVSLIDKKRK